MKIHEYQGKEVFKSYGIPIQDGHIFEKIEDAQSIIDKVQKEFKTEAVVVKAQIHAGGRGKGGGCGNFHLQLKLHLKIVKYARHEPDYPSNWA